MVNYTQIEHEISNKSNKVKKNRSNETIIEVLQIIGLSEKPLSTYDIEKIWIEKFGYDKNLENDKHPHIYKVIKHLSKSEPEYWGKPHPERFLKICYTEKIQQKIQVLEKECHLERNKIEDGIQVISRTFSNPLEGKHIDDMIKRIHNLKKNSRNWRYRLNYKALLKYLIRVHQNNQVSKRTINTMIKNLSSYPDFEFLQYFDIFGNEKVDLLIEIAVELQYQLMTLTLEDLKYFALKRSYEKISYWLSVENHPIIRKFSRFMKKKDIDNTDQLLRELLNYKIRLQKELIPIQQNNLEFMMIDLNRTKQNISNLF